MADHWSTMRAIRLESQGVDCWLDEDFWMVVIPEKSSEQRTYEEWCELFRVTPSEEGKKRWQKIIQK